MAASTMTDARTYALWTGRVGHFYGEVYRGFVVEHKLKSNVRVRHFSRLSRSGPPNCSPRHPVTRARPGPWSKVGGVAKSPQVIVPPRTFDPSFLAPVRSMIPSFSREMRRASLGWDGRMRPSLRERWSCQHNLPHEMPKAYEPGAIEACWAEYWVRERLFHVETPAPGLPGKDKRPVFTLLLPPPNVTGRLHMGHMLNQTQMDIIVRWHRMRGFITLWLPGTDHAG